jgi:4-carboxymuconolactone decarboxylase
MSRFKEITPEAMTPEQAEVWQEIIAKRPSPAGPFNPWLRSPEMARRAAGLGAYLRLRTSLEPRLSELAILVTARHWNCQVEWSIHEPFARQAGLSAAVIKALNHKLEPEFESPDEAAVYAFCRQALGQGQVSEAVFEQCRELLGETGTVELAGLVGYYCLVALSLNIFQVPLPQDIPPRLSNAPVY